MNIKDREKQRRTVFSVVTIASRVSGRFTAHTPAIGLPTDYNNYENRVNTMFSNNNNNIIIIVVRRDTTDAQYDRTRYINTL